MSHVVTSRTQELTTTTGTGTVTLLGATRGHQSFAGIGNGNTTFYMLNNGDGLGWEIGVGTYTASGTTLSRDTVLESSNSGSKITLTGTTLVSCVNPATVGGTNGLLDKLFGATRGSLLVRGASAWSALALGSSGKVLASDGTDAAWTAPAGGAAGGLFSGQMSATLPTSANTGLSTWVNQGSATIADSGAGIYMMTSTTTGLIIRKSASVPSTPYTITTLQSASHVANGFALLGWTDGTKFHVATHYGASALARVDRWSNSTTFSTSEGSVGIQQSTYCWLRVTDDGTNAVFSYSFDGANFTTLLSVAKASGYLGGSGYTSLCWGARSDGTSKGHTLQSYAQA